MSINNSREFLAQAAADNGFIVTDHLLRGSNLQLPPGTYTPDFDTGEVDSVTFKGTAGKDTREATTSTGPPALRTPMSTTAARRGVSLST
jgi:hypothetical protein